MKAKLFRRWGGILLALSTLLLQQPARAEEPNLDTVRFTWTSCYDSRYERSNVFRFKGTASGRFVIDWGDSNQDTIVAKGIEEYISHAYFGAQHVGITRNVVIHALPSGNGIEARIKMLASSLYYDFERLDASGCSALDTLIFDQGINELNVRGCTALTYLICGDATRGYISMTNLDVRDCPLLTVLGCAGNRLTELDVSHNTALTYLNCSRNQLTELDVSHNTALINLRCECNYLTSLDLSHNTALRSLSFGNYWHLIQKDSTGRFDLSILPGMDVSRIKNLKGGHIVGSTLYFDMDVVEYTYDIGYVGGSYNNAGPFHLVAARTDGICDTVRFDWKTDKDKNKSFSFAGIGEFIIDWGDGSKLDTMSAFGLVTDGFGIGNLALTSIAHIYQQENNYTVSLYGVSETSRLLKLNSGGILSLDMSNCTALEYLSCQADSLDWDMSSCISLKKLYCNFYNRTYNQHGSQLRGLDVSKLTALEELNCSYPLDSLDVSKNINLTTLICPNNRLNSLDVSKNINLNSLDCSKNQLTRLDVSRCTALRSLNCSHNQLDSIDVSKNTKLYQFSCANNNLTSLDMSKNINLDWKLDCDSNNLTTLNVSGLQHLSFISCSFNHLKSLDVSGCTSLKQLTCMDNQLTSLNVSSCTSLIGLWIQNNRLTNIDLNDNTELDFWGVDCSYNGIPLSVLNQAYQLLSYGQDEFVAQNQWDTILLPIGKDWDLSKEQRIENIKSTYRITDEYGRAASGDWTENDFVFRFNRAGNFQLKIENRAADYATFTWHVSVKEGIGITLLVDVNNSEWGTASKTGSGIYMDGDEITITATPKSGYRFVNWTKKDGSVFSTEAVHTFSVTENLELTANFEKQSETSNEAEAKDGFCVYARNQVIYLSREVDAVSVYDAAGTCIYNGHASAIPVQHSGLYVVHVNGRVYKVMLM